ncbi:SCO family protein [Noviherbaspirillum denitrificans]|uniref:Cytochrome C oxidase subunit I n=1 Tax=Noviherbaspirillum denitrificans TaxID=1968433 RepID=A0A254TFU3_9BURK|nr:SCO family protein [Noviherbaspirillum denitrificans]OWW21500.1 cytochrome C oxidase subunit I [Noviherbaspirillum denitrificans]
MEKNDQQRKGRWKLFAVIAICASPLIASYLSYYVIKPEGRTNYGALIDPRAYPIPAALGTAVIDGKPAQLNDYQGKWIMLQVGNADCQEACRKQLHNMRQLRLAQGKDMDRIERVWLVTDDKPLETMLMREYDGTHMLRASADAVKAWLPADTGTVPADHIYMIDPLGNLMMRFPKDADPNKMKKDIAKLLKASRIG